MSNTLIDCACGAKDAPDWNGKGQCITCARDAVLAKPQANTVDEILHSMFKYSSMKVVSADNKDIDEAMDKHIYLEDRYVRLTERALKAHYLKEFLDMIGEDEKIFMEDSIASTHFKEGSNHRIKKQRKAAKERFS